MGQYRDSTHMHKVTHEIYTDFKSGFGPKSLLATLQLFHQANKISILSACDSDGSYLWYEGVTDHLPARVLYSSAEIFGLDGREIDLMDENRSYNEILLIHEL